MAEDQEFFVGQKAFIERDGQVLVLLASFGLDFPGGKIQKAETDFTEALKREVREEVGLEIEVGDLFTSWCVEVKPGHKNAGKKVFLISYKCKYLSGEVSLSHEHVGFKWVNKNNFSELYEDNGTYKSLKKYFEGK